MLKHRPRAWIVASDTGHRLTITGIDCFFPDGMYKLDMPFMTPGTHLVRLVLHHRELIGPVDLMALCTVVPPRMLSEHLFPAGKGILVAWATDLPFRSRNQCRFVGSMRRVTFGAQVIHMGPLEMSVFFVERRNNVLMTAQTNSDLTRAVMTDSAIALCKWLMTYPSDQRPAISTVRIVAIQAFDFPEILVEMNFFQSGILLVAT
jgi:hypothetical protein